MGKEALRVSCVVPTSPHAVYMAWLDAPQHGAFAGGKATIDAVVGGRFTARDGKLSGTFVQLDLGRRIIQSWRSAEFPKGAPDSRLEVHFESVIDGTRVTVLHSDLPEGLGEKVKAIWLEGYFHPMRAYFGKMAIAADRASMARMAARASEPDVEEDEEEEEAPPKKGKKAPPPPPPPPSPMKGKKAALPAPTKATKPAKPAKAAPAKPAAASKAKTPPAKAAPKPAAKAAPKATKTAPKKPAPKKPAPKPAAKKKKK